MDTFKKVLNKEPDVITGKPSKFLFDLIRRDCKIDDLSKVVMIGDKLSTDI